jgi:hypothetical protein
MGRRKIAAPGRNRMSLETHSYGLKLLLLPAAILKPGSARTGEGCDEELAHF